jgi:predicted GIY-YIG superfamily endonuclease
MTKERAALHWRAVARPKVFFITLGGPKRPMATREKQLKGWRREKKVDLIRAINPEFKDLAQTCGWKMLTVHEVHEKMYP